jgi:hypothetical protein
MPPHEERHERGTTAIPKTDDDIAELRQKIACGLAHAALLKTRDMVRKLRKDRVKSRGRSRAERLIKELRVLKSLLEAEASSVRAPRRRTSRAPRQP